ncbi:ATP-binding protein [Alkalicella caledoniensis]|uniref:ATP-binding protein n=1 Tax=Alkalicella caledoniensis TaxID=2731377 RepID=A0A7G9W9I5_ALKCA|nr:IS21-like element helper ATPase IstB [Alkalicella caledoniensis]QNO15347.1 ATP-binding protein [Alkalicella caledoniensis]QNO15551.1 ATP-binding protein [Alkalicella caledoniensis]QNO15912.1 ATP-binding protein [Alkalicella caledoniensis]
MMQKETIKRINELCKELKLPGTSKDYQERIDEAYRGSLSYEDFLIDLLEKEYDLRKENGRKNRIRNAKFPYKKYLEDLSIKDLPADAGEKVKIFSTLKFIETGQNIILAGNPGTGKSHMAIGLGIKACNAGYKVLFTTIPLLVNELKECRSQKTLRSFENRFEKYDLIIADELGYISFDKEASELLFTYLSLRAGRKSTIITTNLSFDRWEEIFKDPVMTAAMVDRLTHKSYIVNMNGNSYRLKETQDWLNQQ